MSISRARRYLKEAHQNTKKGSSSLYSYPEALLYFVDMAKDVTVTFTPYKTARHRNHDLWQSINGLGNLLMGVVSGLSSLVFFSGSLLYEVIPSLFTKGPKSCLFALGHSFYVLGGDLLGATAQTLRGVTQIVTSPLTLARVGVRSFLSRNTPWQKFQERKSIQRLVAEIDSIMESNQPGSIGQIRKALNQLARKAESNRDIKKQESIGNVAIPTYQKINEHRISQPITADTYFDSKAKDEDKMTDSNFTPANRPKLADYLFAFRMPEGRLKIQLSKLSECLNKYKTDKEVNTPDVNLALRRAAADGNIKDVKFLLDTGKADINSKSSNGKTAIDWARTNKRLEVIEFLESRVRAENKTPHL